MRRPRFKRLVTLLRASFPKMISLHVDVLDDPDVNGRVWVMLNVLTPQSYPWETQHQEEIAFTEQCWLKCHGNSIPCSDYPFDLSRSNHALERFSRHGRPVSPRAN